MKSSNHKIATAINMVGICMNLFLRVRWSQAVIVILQLTQVFVLTIINESCVLWSVQIKE